MIDQLKVIIHDWLFLGQKSDLLGFFQALTWFIIVVSAYKVLKGLCSILRRPFRSSVPKQTGTMSDRTALVIKYGNVPPGYTVFLYGIDRSEQDSSMRFVLLKTSNFWFNDQEALSIAFQETVQVLATTQELADRIVRTKVS